MAKTKNGKDLGTLIAAGGLWAWQNRDRIRDFLRNEQVQQALKTPQAQQALNSPAARRILEHPQMKSLLANPEFQRWLGGQQQTQTPPSTQEPYTGETRRL